MPEIARSGARSDRRPDVRAALAELFGFDAFRSTEQEELFWKIHDGDDVIGVLPTGAGKSLPFQLSALVGDGVTLVVSPLVALMRDQVENLLDRGIRQVGALVGQMTADERDEVLRRTASGTVKLLYVAPERLRDPVFLEHLRSFDLARVVVDEAHCVSLWGPSFRPDFLAVRDALDGAGHPAVPVAALTATATPEIEHDMRAALRLADAEKVSAPTARPNLRLAVVGNDPDVPGDRITNQKDRIRHLLRILTSAERRGEPAIVYVTTVALCEQLAAQMQQCGLIARAYHGRLDGWSRQNVEELFRDGDIDVIVATKAFGMGIDRADVRYVIHVGCPVDLESYWQEAGRAGRDGDPAWCLLLPLPSPDRSTQEWFIEQVSELDGALADAAGELERLGPGEHLVDLEDLAERLGLEETQARVVLHYLDAGGHLERGPDQTLEASVLLLGPVDDGIVERVRLQRRLTPMVPEIINLVEVSDAIATSARDTEAAFIAASRRGQVVFRPTRRVASVTVHSPRSRRAPDTSAIVSRMHDKLETMLGYASRREECRQVTIRRYLGVPADGLDPCGNCDVCDPSIPRPWLDLPLDRVPVADRLVDAELTCLHAVQWNTAEVAAGRAPYGRSALKLMLTGDRFNLGRYASGAERQRRLRRAEASPYWAALGLMTHPRRRVDEAFESLDRDGCLTVRRFLVTNDRGSGLKEYTYPALSDIGERRVELGLVTT